MRPIKLTMRAFANYAEEQVVDFTQLQNRNMFLVTGNTGAGKTTIFDAISYALFGDASGDGRDFNTFISDYSKGKIKTEVELEFLLKGELYKIIRSPKQPVEGRKTLLSAEATIEKLGTVEHTAGVAAVNKKVEELLGINSKQFKQIVMLPQGEFMKFLKASSAEKRNIFRDIFGTSEFNKIQENLRSKAIELNSDLKEFTVKRDTYLDNIKTIEFSELENKLKDENKDNISIMNDVKDLIQNDENSYNVLQENLIKHKEEIKIISDDKIIFEQDKKIIIEFEKVKSLYDEKLCEKDKYSELKIEVENIKKAKQVSVTEENFIKSKLSLDSREKYLNKCVDDEKYLKKELESVSLNLEQLKKQDEERNKLRIEIEEVLKKQELLKGYIDKKAKLDVARQDYRKAELKSNEEKNNLEMLEKQKEFIEKFILKGKDLAIKQSEIKALIDIKNKKLIKIKNIESKFNELILIKNQMKIQASKLEIARDESNNINLKYENEWNNYINSMAGILAENLTKDDACPVCGSKNHPKKAVRLKSVLTDKEIEELKKVVEEKRVIAEDIAKKIESLKAKFENLNLITIQEFILEFKDEIEDFKNLDYGKKIEAIKALTLDITSKYNTLLKEYDEIKYKTQSITRKEKELEILMANIKVSKEKIHDLDEDKDKIKEVGIQLKENVDIIQQQIPENLRDYRALEDKKNELKGRLELSEFELKNAELKYKNVAENYAKNIQAIEENKKDFELRKRDTFKLEESFKLELLKSLLDIEMYNEYKLKVDKISYYENIIEKFTSELDLLKGRVIGIQKQYDNLKIKDLDSINKQLDILILKEQEMNEEETLFINQINEFKNRADNNKQMLYNIEKINEKIRDKEAVYRNVAYLADVSRGYGANSKKMDFETYILISYFDEIIYYANFRLNKMTAGRFELIRSKLVSGNGVQGLDLNVIDNNTGRERSINSLSGGESFKAALAIALALAQVIESAAGGVSIETMFIDEGFGTLDPESLDMAINCLLELQNSGRLVGVISHVHELKERIDARFEVKLRADNKGSVGTFVIE